MHNNKHLISTLSRRITSTKYKRKPSLLLINPSTPSDLYKSYHTANLQTSHFIYLFNKCRY